MAEAILISITFAQQPIQIDKLFNRCSLPPVRLLVIFFSSISFCSSFALLLIFNNHWLIETGWNECKWNEMNRPKDIFVIGLQWVHFSIKQFVRFNLFSLNVIQSVAIFVNIFLRLGSFSHLTFKLELRSFAIKHFVVGDENGWFILFSRSLNLYFLVR